MIDKEMVKNKISRIQQDLTHLREFIGFSFDEAAKNYKTHKIIERIIEVIINEAIDINQHIIVEKGEKDLPFDFRQSFLLLVDIGVYPREFAQQISKSVGLRNILVHEYLKLDEKIFYKSIKDCYEDYTKYCRYILDYLTKLT